MKKTVRLFQSIALQLALVFFIQAPHAQNTLVLPDNDTLTLIAEKFGN